MHKIIAIMIIIFAIICSYTLYSINTYGNMANFGVIPVLFIVAIFSIVISLWFLKRIKEKPIAFVLCFIFSYLVLFGILIGGTVINDDLAVFLYLFPIISVYFIPIVVSSILLAHLWRKRE